MGVLEEKFNEQELNIGKILILDENHGFTSKEIKKITNAEKVINLRVQKNNELSRLLHGDIFNGLRSKNPNQTANFDFYLIEGKSAVTTFIRLKSNKVLGSILLNAKAIKNLHNCCIFLASVENAKRILVYAKNEHDKTTEILENYSHFNNLKRKTKMYEKLINGYGDGDIKNAVNIISQVMKNSW